MSTPKPGPYLVRKQNPDNMQTAGTTSWGAVWELISAPHGLDAVDAQFVAFCPDQADAALLAQVHPLRQAVLTLSKTIPLLLQAANPATPFTDAQRLQAITQGLTALSETETLLQHSLDHRTQLSAAYLANPSDSTWTTLRTALLTPQEQAGPALLSALKALLAFHQGQIDKGTIPGNLLCENQALVAIRIAEPTPSSSVKPPTQ